MFFIFCFRFSSLFSVFHFKFFIFRSSFSLFVFRFLFFVFRFMFFIFCFSFSLFIVRSHFCIVVLRQASFARRPSLYSQNEAKRVKRPGNSGLFAERNEVERSVLAIPVYIFLYYNATHFWILSSTTCSVHLAHQIDLKTWWWEAFFVEKKNLLL